MENFLVILPINNMRMDLVSGRIPDIRCIPSLDAALARDLKCSVFSLYCMSKKS